MPNKNYVKGVRKERKVVNSFRDRGYIALRSAGSHSPIDVVCISKHRREIELIQCKPDSMSDNARLLLENKHKSLNGLFKVRFIVI